MRMILTISNEGRPTAEIRKEGHKPLKYEIASAEFWRIVVREVEEAEVRGPNGELGVFRDIDRAFEFSLEIIRKLGRTSHGGAAR